MKNQAFIDGQNLYMNTKSYGWKINLLRLRVYLREKYSVDEAYYFLGAESNKNKRLYSQSKMQDLYWYFENIAW